MVISVKSQETTETASRTKATPAFAVMEPVRRDVTRETEAGDGNYWPAGIDYSSVTLPHSAKIDDSVDRLEILEFLDD